MTPWKEMHSVHLEMAWHGNSYGKGQQLWIREEMKNNVNMRSKRGAKQDMIQCSPGHRKVSLLQFTRKNT